VLKLLDQTKNSLIEAGEEYENETKKLDNWEIYNGLELINVNNLSNQIINDYLNKKFTINSDYNTVISSVEYLDEYNKI
jgi:hypothetical protein